MKHVEQDEMSLVHSALTRLDDIRREYRHVTDLKEVWDFIEQAWRKRFHTIEVRGFPSSKGEAIVTEYPDKAFPFSTEEEMTLALKRAREYAEERDRKEPDGNPPEESAVED